MPQEGVNKSNGHQTLHSCWREKRFGGLESSVSFVLQRPTHHLLRRPDQEEESAQPQRKPLP